jgi:hypothetical protein
MALVVAGTASLYGHAPRDFAASYSPPTAYGDAYQEAEYAAVPRAAGGWDLFYVDNRRHAVFKRVSDGGRTLVLQRVATKGETINEPVLAENGGHILAAWVKEDNGALSLWGAYLGIGHPTPFRLNPAGGLVEHPYLLPVPGGSLTPGSPGGFLLLFEWQHPNAFAIFLSFLPAGARRPTFVRRLTWSTAYGFYPRAAIDGSGALDMAHLELCCRQKTWLVVFQRFSALGRPLSRPRILDSLNQQVVGTPSQWGIDVKRGADGSVWAAWEGEQWVSVARWDARGHMVVTPTRVFFGDVDLPMPALALALLPHHGAKPGSGGAGEVYFASQNALGSHLMGLKFDAAGRRVSRERVEYSSNGTAAFPRAGMVRGRPAILWEKLANDGLGAVIEGSIYRPASPSLAARLGIGVGNAAGNLAMIVVGALLFGAVLTVGNLPALLALILAWLPIGRFAPRRTRLALYLGFVAAALIAVFAVPKSPPAFILFMSGIGRPYGWLAAGGAVFVGYWTGRRLVGHQEPILRAAAIGIAAFYFVAVIYAATAVQAELGRI